MVTTQSNSKTILYYLSDRKYHIHRHLMLQLFVLVLSSSVLFAESGKMILTANRLCAWGGLYLVVNLMIYPNAYIFAPRYLVKGMLFKYILSIFLLLALSVLITGLSESIFYNPDAEYVSMSLTNEILNALTTIFTLGLVIVGVAAFVLLKKWMEDNQRADELKAATLTTELMFLKSQINPHFLFNMLNNANILTDDDPEMASQILVKLDDLLRYQMNDSTREMVYLNADIAFLRDYLELEKTRRDNFEYTISKKGNINNVQVAPLLFIPFVENAVKHNLDSEGKSFVNLLFKVGNGTLQFVCENSIPQTEIIRKVGGIGLVNIKRRLDLLYKDNYVLGQTKTATTYTITLHLKR